MNYIMARTHHIGEESKQAVEWRGSVPISVRFDDPYFSLEDGLAETRYVFLAGNDLTRRYRDKFHIAELGFGTGLNALAACHLWHQSNIDGTLSFTSFEAFPMTKEEANTALSSFEEIADLRDELIAGWDRLLRGETISVRAMDLQLVLGEVAETLPEASREASLEADAWFLDGFSPAKNPSMWTPSVLSHVGHMTPSGGTVATYCAAGHVRRALTEAGFDVMRTKGFARKRHMTRGTKR